MLVLTIVIITLLLLFSYVVFDKDFFAPPCVVALVFLFGCLCTLYNEERWGLNFDFRTGGLIVTAIIGFFIGGILGVVLSSVTKKTSTLSFSLSHKICEPQEIKIESIKTILIIIFQLVVLVLVFSHIRSLTGSSNWLVAVEKYRSITGRLSDANDVSIRMPVITRNLVEIDFLVGLMYSYIVGNNLIASKKKVSINWIPIILYSLTTFMQGDRSNMIRLWLTIIIVAYTISKRSVGWTSKRETRKMFKAIILSVIVVGVIFVGVRGIAGRTSTADPLYYLTFYAGSPTAVLDQIWVSPRPKPDLFGKYTFSSLYRSLTVLIGWPTERYNMWSDFIRSPNGSNIGNARTALRDPYTEFGYFGFAIYCILMGTFYSLLHAKVRIKKGNNPIDMRLLLYSYIAYTYFMYFYSIFNAYLTHAFIKYIVYWFIIRWFLVGLHFKQSSNMKIENNLGT